ncbi:MAG: sulfate ABC transporter permease subunit CysT [Deltaproteobacteria bacterium]|nr:sulfate ABC transporter permease subunit CysT [Deltaproteobacteria bacterium]
MMFAWKRKSVLPGFGLTFGYAVFYLSLMVLIPLSALIFRTAGMTGAEFIATVTSPRVLASYRVTFGAAFLAASVNALFGTLLAWVLVRYRFPGRRLIDALVDLPFALPTAVVGIALAAVYSANGWVGSLLEPLGLKVAYRPAGIVIAMIIISLPFVVRTLQPVIEDIERETEEAAVCLGANRWQTFRLVLLPSLVPSILTGFALAFARSLGEYGSVIFIAGNMPMVSEITSLMIITKLEQFNYSGAAAIASVMLAASFAVLLLINLLQRWSRRYAEA